MMGFLQNMELSLLLRKAERRLSTDSEIFGWEWSKVYSCESESSNQWKDRGILVWWGKILLIFLISFWGGCLL